ncbi:hypothetical protein [Streptosporangium sandarakinum]
MAEPITPERLTEIEARAAKVVEVFGDDWPLEYEHHLDEVVCRIEDQDAPFTNVFIEVFRTSQWMEGELTSPLAEFLAASIKDVPALLAEVKRLRAAVDLLGSQLQGGSQTFIDALTELEQRLPAEHVERFLKRERDEHGKQSYWWKALDEALDAFRLHLVTGTPLTEPRPIGGPEAPGVGPEPLTEAEELRAEVERVRAERDQALAEVERLRTEFSAHLAELERQHSSLKFAEGEIRAAMRILAAGEQA